MTSNGTQKYLDWIASQQARMVSLVDDWSSINSGTYNVVGVERVAEAILPEFSSFGVTPELVSVPAHQEVDNQGKLVDHPLGPALSLRVRPQASRRVLLAIHMDTVYAIDSDFQTVHRDSTRLFGPGVADAKGGIAVMLTALQALEQFVSDSGIDDLGWEVLLNPDEEIGAPGSASLLHGAATRNHVGLLFEPSLPNGDLVSERKGSANLHIHCRGKSAHAGRHFAEGRNAIATAAEIALQLNGLNGKWDGTTLNVARIDGGGPLNMVPDTAVVRLNVRYPHHCNQDELEKIIDQIVTATGKSSGVETQRFGEFTTPPKRVGIVMQQIIDQVTARGKTLGLDLNWQPTGGVCDGNRLAGWGLPNVDTMGVRGAGIHSRDEYVILESLTERASLTAGLLIGWASGKITWPADADTESRNE
ncbi:MAG: hydrolase [Pirellulaceae bacterium]|nr:hydrolase [Planctomycetota bacterium]